MKQIHFIGLDSNNHMDPRLTAALLLKFKTMFEVQLRDEDTLPFLLATWFRSEVRSTSDMANINNLEAKRLQLLLQETDIEISFQGFGFFNNLFDNNDEELFFAELHTIEQVAAEAGYTFKQYTVNELTQAFLKNELTPSSQLKTLDVCVNENHREDSLSFLALQQQKFVAIAKKINERAEVYEPLFVFGPIADIVPLIKMQEEKNYTVHFLCEDMEQATFNALQQLLVRQLLPQMILAQKATAQ